MCVRFIVVVVFCLSFSFRFCFKRHFDFFPFHSNFLFLDFSVIFTSTFSFSSLVFSPFLFSSLFFYFTSLLFSSLLFSLSLSFSSLVFFSLLFPSSLFFHFSSLSHFNFHFLFPFSSPLSFSLLFFLSPFLPLSKSWWSSMLGKGCIFILENYEYSNIYS